VTTAATRELRPVMAGSDELENNALKLTSAAGFARTALAA
jgi:hypothetical protein